MPPAIEVVEVCPLKTATIQWQSPKAPILTLVVKATYDLVAGMATLCETQDDVNDRDLHAENNPELGLYSASDLAPFKPRADVTVVGKAYAPTGELARALVARLRVGAIDKQVEVHAERYMRADGRIRDNKFFSKMGLGYEHAPGGPNTDNPVGRSMKPGPDGRVVLPNLQRPGQSPALDRPLAPVGFGPLPASWPGRQRLAGDHAAWLGADWAAEQVPERFDWRHFNVAPADQQLDEIRADERVRLDHLHPEEEHLVTQLPGVVPRAYIERAEGAQRIELKGDTLWIDTNRMRMTLCWRGTLALRSPDEQARILVGMATPSREMSWDEIWQAAERKKAQPSRPGPTRPEGPPSQGHGGAMPAMPASAPSTPTRSSEEPDESWLDDGPTNVVKPATSKRKPKLTVPLSATEAEAWSPAVQRGAIADPVSSTPDLAQAMVVELTLSEADARKLNQLSVALGKDAVGTLRHALRLAYRGRFVDE